MDDDLFLSNFPTGPSPSQFQGRQPMGGGDYLDTVPIFVEADWGSSTQTGVQLCPAIFIPSATQIPKVAKHIFSRLAATASELDQGVPEVLLSLVGTGNSFSFENSDRLVSGLAQFIGHCSLWAVSSGEQNDPLAQAISTAFRSKLGQSTESSQQQEETLHIVVNFWDVRHTTENAPNAVPTNEQQLKKQRRNAPTMADARLNTLCLLWAKDSTEEERRQLPLFRACAAVKLANPPPALLIGIPEERQSATAVPGPFSQGQTPLGEVPTSPSAILLPSVPSSERQPLPFLLYCGANLPSLLELLANVQCGVPALLVQDISELCVVLKAAFCLYQSACFEHKIFDHWLERELRMVALATEGGYEESEIDEAKLLIFQLLLTVSTSEHCLLAFMPSHQLDKLGEHVIDLLLRSASDANEIASVLALAVKIGAHRALKSIKLEGLLGEEQISGLLMALVTGDRLEMLAAFLDQNVPLAIDLNFLMEWAGKTSDQYFFNTIVMGHLLGLGQVRLEKMQPQHMAKQFNRLMADLSGVSTGLFPLENSSLNSFKSSTAEPERSLRLLACWALLLHRPNLVRLFCAYSAEPMAMALCLAKSARTLAKRSRCWLFYEQSLIRLAQQLTRFAVQLLDKASAEDHAKAYNALCRPLPSFRQMTLSQLAYETNCRDFIAHECCQRWVLRLFHGRIHIRTISRHFCLPNWLKLLLSALFVLPIAIWIRPSPSMGGRRGIAGGEGMRPSSPTVALLEDGRRQQQQLMRKARTSSANSMHSMKSAGGLFGGEIVGSGRAVDLRRNSMLLPGDAIVNLVNGGAAGLDMDAIQQVSNEDSTLTDSFLPSASQMHGEGGIDTRRRREDQQQRESQIILHQQRDGGGANSSSRSRRHSPDRRSLMFYDGGSGGGGSFTDRNRRRSRTSSSRLLAMNPSGGGGAGTFAGRKGRHSTSFPFCPLGIGTIGLFYSTPIAKYWLSLSARLLYLLLFGFAVAQPGCFLAGWREQLLWLWALCWLFDSLWVFVCRAQLGDWRQQRWALFDLVICAAFLGALLAMRICVSSRLGWPWPTAYHIRASWALFLLYECHKSLFLYVPLSPVLGPMLVRIRLMLLRDLVNFLLLILLLIASSAVAIKATLYPDLSAKAEIMAETLAWTFQQLFTTDLAVLRQSGECQRQLLPEGRPFCQAMGGFADPRCPAAQHFLAQFTVFHYLILLKLLAWPILFALFARTARRVEEEADQIWKFQLYSLATGFSLRPCLPPPFTPIFLLQLACCHFGLGRRIACIFHGSTHGPNSLAQDHPDMGASAEGQQNGGQPKFCTVYRNPSVPISRNNSLLGGYWRRLAIGLWKGGEQKSGTTEAKIPAEKDQSGDKTATLLMGFNGLQQMMRTEGDKGDKQKNETTCWNAGQPDKMAEGQEQSAEMSRGLGVQASCRAWLHLLPHYRPNVFSKPVDQFPVELQRHVDDVSMGQQQQGGDGTLLELAKQWRQRRLAQFMEQLDSDCMEEADKSGEGEQEDVLLAGNGLPLNPRGRTGMAGRGNFARFGPNRRLLYALFRKEEEQQTGDDIQVLVQCPTGQLPSRWDYAASGHSRVDEFLAHLLLQLGLPDPEIHALSSKTALRVGQKDGRVGLLRVDGGGGGGGDVELDEQETDNAWPECRLYAVDLSRACAHFHQLIEGGEFGWRAVQRLADQRQKLLVTRAVAFFGQ